MPTREIFFKMIENLSSKIDCSSGKTLENTNTEEVGLQPGNLGPTSRNFEIDSTILGESLPRDRSFRPP